MSQRSTADTALGIWRNSRTAAVALTTEDGLQSKKEMLMAVELLIHSLGYSGIGFRAHAVLTSAFTTSRASLLF